MGSFSGIVPGPQRRLGTFFGGSAFLHDLRCCASQELSAAGEKRSEKLLLETVEKHLPGVLSGLDRVLCLHRNQNRRHHLGRPAISDPPVRDRGGRLRPVLRAGARLLSDRRMVPRGHHSPVSFISAAAVSLQKALLDRHCGDLCRLSFHIPGDFSDLCLLLLVRVIISQIPRQPAETKMDRNPVSRDRGVFLSVSVPCVLCGAVHHPFRGFLLCLPGLGRAFHTEAQAAAGLFSLCFRPLLRAFSRASPGHFFHLRVSHRNHRIELYGSSAVVFSGRGASDFVFPGTGGISADKALRFFFFPRVFFSRIR